MKAKDLVFKLMDCRYKSNRRLISGEKSYISVDYGVQSMYSIILLASMDNIEQIADALKKGLHRGSK